MYLNKHSYSMNVSFKKSSLIAEIFVSFSKCNETRRLTNKILLYSASLVKYFFEKYVVQKYNRDEVNLLERLRFTKSMRCYVTRETFTFSRT